MFRSCTPSLLSRLWSSPTHIQGESYSKEPPYHFALGPQIELSSLRFLYSRSPPGALGCRTDIAREVSFLRVAACCTVLRSQWYQFPPRVDLRLRTPFARPLEWSPSRGTLSSPPSCRPLAPSRCASSLRASRSFPSWTAGPLLWADRFFAVSRACACSRVWAWNQSILVRSRRTKIDHR
jgi:hypothetical protein